MKKFSFLCAVFLILTVILPVSADSVWTPMDDYFYDTWQPESDNTCTSQERPYYVAAGKQGYVTAVKTPLDRTELTSYPNGTMFKIAFVCGKGDNLWGAVEAVRKPNQMDFVEDWMGNSGYIPFDDLVRAYDAEAFEEDHQDEIQPFDANTYDFCNSGEFLLWSAPNSGIILEFADKSYISYLCMDYSPDSQYHMFELGDFYQDPDGNRWVEARLRRVSEHGWFCLDHMTDSIW